MAIDIKVIPTLHGDEAIRFINNADEVMKSKERVDLMLSGIREILIVSTLYDFPGALLEVIRMKR